MDKNNLKDLEQLDSKITSIMEQSEREALFTDSANKLFELNIRAFQKYFPDIAEKFLSHQPSENFNLFLNSNSSPNIIDYDTGLPMYSETPLEQAKKQVEKMFESPILGRVDHSGVEFVESDTNFKHVDLMRRIGSIYNNAKNSLPSNYMVNKYVPSAIIFGVGLGYHLNYMFEDFNAAYITIFEPNEDYFFASLFSFDWFDFLEKVDRGDSFLYISVGLSEAEMSEALYNRSSQIGAFSVSSAVFFQHYPSKSINRLISEFKGNYHQHFMGWGFFDDALMSISHTVKNFEDGFALLNHKSLIEQPHPDYPIFIIANGPSLDNDIEVIKSHQENAIIVACNSATTSLLKYGIVPDFHVALERTKSTEDFLTAFIPKELRNEINLLVLNVMYPDVLNLFGWAGVALKGKEAGTSLFNLAEFKSNGSIHDILPFSNPLVGNTALSFFGSLKFNNLYLFGVDNGYKDPEYHHSKSSYYYSGEGKTVHAPLKMGGKHSVTGNFGGKVLTDNFMYVGKVQMERFIDFNKLPSSQVYNCSDGCYIKGTLPLASNDILLTASGVDKKAVVNEIKELSFSQVDEKINIKEYLDFDVFEDLCTTLSSILNSNVSNREEALEQLLKSLRYLFSFKNNLRYSHLFLLLEGEALYVTSVMISLLYNFGDDEEIIPFYMQAKDMWKEFIVEAPNQYRTRWNVLSDYSFDYSKPSVS